MYTCMHCTTELMQSRGEDLEFHYSEFHDVLSTWIIRIKLTSEFYSDDPRRQYVVKLRVMELYS